MSVALVVVAGRRWWRDVRGGSGRDCHIDLFNYHFNNLVALGDAGGGDMW
jgi:hypothetical protein